MTTAISRNRNLTQAEFLAELRDRFGEDPMNWAFTCTNCGDTATGQDFADALKEHPRTRRAFTQVTASDILGQECIGRILGALSVAAGEWKGRGCDWTAYGLLRGPWAITIPGGRVAYSFPLAEAPAATPTTAEG